VETACASLNLPAAGVETREGGLVVTDGQQNTSAPGVYALGDVASNGVPPGASNFPLTPVAIAAGRLLADRLFGGPAHAGARVSYSARNIPTVVFSHPPLGTVGLTEAEAAAAFGAGAVKAYRATFAGMLRAFMPKDDAPRTTIKVVTRGEEEVVVGVHVHGDGADEMLQGFGVAVAAGLTMRDFNATMAIHPTAAEEVVTFKPWAPRTPAWRDAA